jgi:hypothetical protein
MLEKTCKNVQPLCGLQFRKDHQIEQTVIEQGIGTDRQSSACLTAIADCHRHERTFPAKPGATKRPRLAVISWKRRTL